MNPINQQSIANQLGLSRATISRCFTNHRAINPSTRARVFELAAKLGYHYLDVRTKSRRRSRPIPTVGVLIAYAEESKRTVPMESPGPELLDGISQLAQLRGVQLDIHYVDPAEQTLEGPSYQRVAGLHQAVWSGAVLIYAFPGAIVEALITRLPCVSLLEQNERVELNCVDVDHHRGMAQVMELLVDRGHRRIGFFSVISRTDCSWTMHRFQTFLEKLLRLGQPFRPEDMINVLPDRVFSKEEALAQMRAQTENGVTAWVCATDYGAYSVVAELAASGVRVPEEVSVTGFDGIKPEKGMPRMTTLEAPFREIGITGCRRLLDLIQAPYDPAQHILVGCRLRKGETVAAVPRARSVARARERRAVGAV